jgi:hypothetical protein
MGRLTRVSVEAEPRMAMFAYRASGLRWVEGENGSPTPTRAAVSLAQVAQRIRAGCVYEAQPEETLGLLVTRHDPRARWHARPVRAAIDAHWPLLAPSMHLLTGQTAPRQRQRDPHERGPALGWEGFAAAYRAELERWPFLVQLAVVRQIATWLCSYRTVTILSFEPSMPRGAALAAWKQRGEFVPWAQRHVFREWLLRLPPIELCVVGAPAPERGAVVKGEDAGMVR